MAKTRIQKINWETGNKNSHEPIEKNCVDCGRVFLAPRNIQRNMKRCQSCATEHRLEIERKRSKQNRRLHHSGDGSGNYQIVIDADNSWGFDSRLDKLEIMRLLELGYIATGTVIKQISSNQHYWVFGKYLRQLEI